VPLDPAAIQHVKTIALLDARAPEADECAYWSEGAIWAGGGGLVGLVVDRAVCGKAEAQMRAAIRDHIDLSKMMTEELQKALEQSGFEVVRFADRKAPYYMGLSRPARAFLSKDAFVQDYASIQCPKGNAILDPVCSYIEFKRETFSSSDQLHVTLALRLVSPDGRQEYLVDRYMFGWDTSRLGSSSPLGMNPRRVRTEDTGINLEDVSANPQAMAEVFRKGFRALAVEIARDLTAGR
jgi:hypothetical protein